MWSKNIEQGQKKEHGQNIFEPVDGIGRTDH